MAGGDSASPNWKHQIPSTKNQRREFFLKVRACRTYMGGCYENRTRWKKQRKHQTKEKELRMLKHPPVEHELDAAWIIALWLLIHGGDPPPPIEKVALEAIEALSSAILRAGTGHVGNVAAFQSRLKELGIELEVPKESKGKEQPESIVFNRTYCFVFQGQRLCITFNKVVNKIPGT